jgi:hypothetical protein
MTPQTAIGPSEASAPFDAVHRNGEANDGPRSTMPV